MGPIGLASLGRVSRPELDLELDARRRRGLLTGAGEQAREEGAEHADCPVMIVK